MLVELDVFSGRANPQWGLDETASATLVQLQERLNRSAETPAVPPGLGYRGFLYAARGGPIRAYRGFLTRGTIALADPQRSVERFLLEHMPNEFGQLRARLTQEISRPGKGP